MLGGIHRLLADALADIYQGTILCKAVELRRILLTRSNDSKSTGGIWIVSIIVYPSSGVDVVGSVADVP